MMSRSFLVEFFDFFQGKIMSSGSRDSLPFLFVFLFFSSSSCLLVLSRNSTAVLNKSGESGHPCLSPDFRGNSFSFSPLGMMLAIGLSYIAFIMLRFVPSIPSCQNFPMKGC
jgi:hypothetical protein